MAAKQPPALTRVKVIPELPARSVTAHKGDFGRVLVLGGSIGMLGAPTLVASSALRSGAGLVTIAVPKVVQAGAAVLCPCATSIALPATASGQIDPGRALELLQSKGLLAADGAPDALVVGPGVGTESAAGYAASFWHLIDAFRLLGVPAVVDADGLNLAGRDGTAAWDQRPHQQTVITPHPGEMARMHGVSTSEIQANREGYAVQTALAMRGPQSLAPEDRPVVVLKGAGTVVTDAHRIYVNRTGNPGMATGGSGDVLAGIIGALIGQGLTPFDAAVAGVHIHGLAGDLAAERFGQISMIATDIITCLPEAFQEPTQSKRRVNRRAKTNR